MTQTKLSNAAWNYQHPDSTALSARYNQHWSVIPLDSDKRPVKTGGTYDDGNSKRLKWKHLQERLSTEQEIRIWQKKYNPSAWAIVTGAKSGRIVLDFDGETGLVTLKRLGLNPHVRTGSGGYHVHFKHPGWPVQTLNNKSSKDRPWAQAYPGLDIRADGGYAAFCGSNESGKYEWLREPEPDDLSILPEDLRAYLGLLEPPGAAPEPTPVTRTISSGNLPDILLDRALDRIGMEGRDNAAFWLACQLRDNQVPGAESVMRAYARRVPPTNTKGQIEAFTEVDAIAKLTSADSRPARQAWEAKEKKEVKSSILDDLTVEKVSTPPKRKFLYASEVQPEPIDYLWTKRLAKGMFTLLAGDPGLGKSLLCSAIAAETTKGNRLPDGKAAAPGGVIIMAPEDSNEHTIIPRLKAAGADLSKVLLLSEVPDFDSDGNPYNRPISFPEDAAILEEAMIECKASLAIIDPVLAMVNGKYDTHKDQESRQSLSRVLAVAKRQHCAILGVFHLNKAQNGNALYRSTASIAFIAMARIGLFLVLDPDNPENGRVLVNHKNNLAAKATSLRFTIEQTADEIAYIEWNGASTHTEQELLGGAMADNPKSEQETGILDVLKANREAMTPADIYEKLPTWPSTFNALEQMLKRKLEQGVLMRPSRGHYTYNGNPLYAKTDSPETHVSNVSNVSLHSSESDTDQNASAEADLSKTDITDITDITFTTDLPSRMTICCNAPFQHGPAGPECSNPLCPERRKAEVLV